MCHPDLSGKSDVEDDEDSMIRYLYFIMYRPSLGYYVTSSSQQRYLVASGCDNLISFGLTAKFAFSF